MNSYPLGSQIRFRATFKDADHEPTNPTVVTLRVVSPGGSETELVPVNDGPGLYSATFEPETPGPWFARWKGVGVVVAASPDIPFSVQATRLTP